jgi:putative transcriptional regulator
MKTKAIEFNAEDLVRSVEELVAHARGERRLTLRTKTLRLPQRARALSAREIRALRERMKVSQPVFAALLNITVDTAASWENGRRRPTGPALRLLEIARRQPQILTESLRRSA